MLSFIASNQSRPEPTEAPNLPNEPIQEPQAIRVNLRDYGFAKAGEHHGDASALANLFNQIRQGFILDENANGEKQQLERERIDEEINGLERTTGELRTEIRRINETEIPKVEAAVQAIDDEINDIKLDVLKKTKEPHHRNRFNLIVYWSVFIPATLFLVLFYVSAFHAGFYRDVIGEAQRAGNDNINSVLNTIFNRQAFNELNLHWLSPIVFFVFGLILHIVYEDSGWRFWVKITFVLLFILGADGLLAFFVEDKSQQVKIMMGMGEEGHHFYHSPVFYMVLTLGYFTCLGWSIILHQIKHEFEKLDVEKVAQLEIKARKAKRLTSTNQIQDLKADVVKHEGTIEGLSRDIEQLRRKRAKISLSLSDLQKRVTDFYDGWLSYVNLRGRDNTAIKESCQNTLDLFYQNHLPQSVAIAA